MTLGSIRPLLLDWLNRTDISTQQANLLIQRGLARCNNDIRVPAMEQQLIQQANGNPIERMPLPDDLLAVKSVEADGMTLLPVTYTKLVQLPPFPGRGAVFARDGGSLVVRPLAQNYVRLIYVGAFGQLVNDTDTNAILGFSPEALLFAALSYAGDFFSMTDKSAAWETRYQQIVTTLNQNAQSIDNLGGPMAVRPVGAGYGYDAGY